MRINLIAILLFSLFTPLFSQNIDSILNEALFPYKNLIQSDSIQKKLIKSFDHKHIFFIAEMHGLSINLEYQFFFLRLLNEYANVRNLFNEYSYGTSYLINEYLKTGDTIYLRSTTNYKSELYRKYWNMIYNWNQDLPVDKKIAVYGIGRYNWPIIAPVYFCLPGNSEIPKEITDIKKLYANNKPPTHYGKGFNEKDNQKLRKRLKNKLQKYPNLKFYFGSNYLNICRIVNNLAAYNPTDKSMYLNFQEINNGLEGNSMIIFGSYHCFLTRWIHKYDPIASLINESETYKGKVYSTIGYYENCTTSQGTTVNDDGLKPFSNQVYNRMLVDAAFKDSDFSILNLDCIPNWMLLNDMRYANLLFLMKNQKSIR